MVVLILVDISSVHGLLLDAAKPLPESKITHRQLGFREHLTISFSAELLLLSITDTYAKYKCETSRACQITDQLEFDDW